MEYTELRVRKLLTHWQLLTQRNGSSIPHMNTLGKVQLEDFLKGKIRQVFRATLNTLNDPIYLSVHRDPYSG